MSVVPTKAVAKSIMNIPGEYKRQAEMANARLDALAKARKTQQSIAGKQAKKYLKRHDKKTKARSRFETDITKLPANKRLEETIEIMKLNEHPSGDVGRLVEMQAERKTNFINQIINYADASQDDKQILRDYLESMSDSQFNKLADFYEPVMGKGLNRDSDEKFQYIGNDLIQKAQQSDVKTTNSVVGQLLNDAKALKKVAKSLDALPRHTINNLVNVLDATGLKEDIENDLYNFYVANLEKGADPDDPAVYARFKASLAAIKNVSNPLQAFNAYASTESAELYKYYKAEMDYYQERYDKTDPSKVAGNTNIGKKVHEAAGDYIDANTEKLEELKANYKENNFVSAISNSLMNGNLGHAAVQAMNYFVEPNSKLNEYVKSIGTEYEEQMKGVLTPEERQKVLSDLGEVATAVKTDVDLSKFFQDGDVVETVATTVITPAAQKALDKASKEKAEKTDEQITEEQKLVKTAGNAVIGFVKGFLTSGGNIFAGLGNAAKDAVKTYVKEELTDITSNKQVKKSKKEKAAKMADNWNNYQSKLMQVDPNASAKEFGKVMGVTMRDPVQVKKHPKRKSTITKEDLKKIRFN